MQRLVQMPTVVNPQNSMIDSSFLSLFQVKFPNNLWLQPLKYDDLIFSLCFTFLKYQHNQILDCRSDKTKHSGTSDWTFVHSFTCRIIKNEMKRCYRGLVRPGSITLNESEVIFISSPLGFYFQTVDFNDCSFCNSPLCF